MVDNGNENGNGNGNENGDDRMVNLWMHEGEIYTFRWICEMKCNIVTG